MGKTRKIRNIHTTGYLCQYQYYISQIDTGVITKQKNQQKKEMH